jgi:hypothetical protein
MCEEVDFAFGGAFPPEMNMVNGPGGSQPLQEVERVRSVFPETWMWQNLTVRCAFCVWWPLID